MMRSCKKCGVSLDHLPAHRIYCGNQCSARGSRNRKHGLIYTSEYMAWRDMKSRCFNPKHKNYPGYGGRGITVCQRWLESFENFYADMGLKPAKGYSIERKENNGNYEPSNCKWATKSEQSRNRRPWSEWNMPDQQHRQGDQS
jgi:hypothetical protein